MNDTIPEFVRITAKCFNISLEGRSVGRVPYSSWQVFAEDSRNRGLQKLRYHGINASNIDKDATGQEDLYVFWDSDNYAMIIVYSDPEIYLKFLMLVC